MIMIHLTFFLNQAQQTKLSSSTIASKILGAPAKHYKPAPVDDKIIATIVKYLVGQEISAAIKYSSLYKVFLSATNPNKIGLDI